jgi:hypothetical protein
MARRRPLWLIKLLNYEYWSWWFFYLPMLPYWLYLALRARSLTFFTAANPFIEMGGFFGESKKNILDKIPSKYLPQTLIFELGTPASVMWSQMQNAGLDFPIVAKPDVGERGTQVAKLYQYSDLETYVAEALPERIILQEFVDYPIELGVLYVRLPEQSTGRITSVTLKEFLTVTGDGQRSILALMETSDRARFQIPRLRQLLGAQLDEVLPAGEVRLLEPIGNHCRGTKFIDANYLITKSFEEVFVAIGDVIPQFHFGRFDLRIESIEAASTGQGIRIMELNGASSEPGHIYDPRHTLWEAYRDLAWHWHQLSTICLQQRERGHGTVSFWELFKATYHHLKTH